MHARRALPLIPILLVLATGLSCRSGQGDVEPPGQPASPTALMPSQEVRPFLARWCVSCHRPPEPEGGLLLTTYVDAEDIFSHVGVARAVRERLALGEMPPMEAPQPPAADVERVLRALSNGVLASKDAPADPGFVPLRRLSRSEYANTVRDLVGASVDVRGLLPPDELGGGFDNLGGVATLSPLAVEKYVAAAERLAAEALPDEDPEHPAVRKLEALRMTASPNAGRANGEWWYFYSGGTLEGPVTLPRDGRYRLRARTWGDQAGPEVARIGFRAAGRQVAVQDVPERRGTPGVREVELALKAGPTRVGVAFVNDYYEPKAKDPSQRDRNLAVEWVEVVGPLDPLAESGLARAFRAADPGGGDAAARAEALLAPFAARAFRRPVEEIRSDGTAGRLADLVVATVEGGRPFRQGLRLAVTSVLASPRFLFRVEKAPGEGEDSRALDGYELAVRLAYFLWSAPPDDELYDAASSGALDTPRGRHEQVRRMLRDARASALSENFAAQWLELRNLSQVAPDPALYPDFDDALRTSMRRETELFVEALVREQRPLRELLDADFTYVDGRLARHYGLALGADAPFRRIRLDGDRRGGVLTQASVLTLTSNPDRTSPVKRGKWVLDNLLDDPPPPPPPLVGNLDESPEAVRGKTLRERLAQHAKDSSCVSCHARMDPLGFALEGYDPVGRPRTRDADRQVDDVGTLPDGRTVTGAAGLRALLVADPRFPRAVAHKLFAFGVGRALRHQDERAIDGVLAGIAGGEATFAEVISGIVETEAFRVQGAPDTTPDGASGEQAAAGTGDRR